MRIFNSASKIVFVMMAGGVIAFTATKVITGEQFLSIAGMAFAFYFTKSQPAIKPD